MKKGLMQVDPMTGMPVAQTASSPMYPVSPTSAMGGSSARFNPMINQYATEDPLANASLAAQPMPTFANGMYKAIPEDATGLQNLAKSGPKGKAAVENMGYETNALARMKGNGMYKKNCGYKK